VTGGKRKRKRRTVAKRRPFEVSNASSRRAERTKGRGHGELQA